MSHFLPHVNYQEGGSSRSADPFSYMLSHRAVFLSDGVDAFSSASVVAQLLALDKQSNKDIDLYINSPGGVVTAGLAIYDTMHVIKSKVNTICLGQACSMGSFLLAGGTGRRCATEHSRVMIHQILGGAQGQGTDVQIQAREMERLKQLLTGMIAENCDKPFDYVLNACERDNFLTPESALEFGLIDEIITSTHKK